MTLDIDTALTAAERTEAARQLIGRARDGELVDLAVLSALDLCALGGRGTRCSTRTWPAPGYSWASGSARRSWIR